LKAYTLSEKRNILNTEGYVNMKQPSKFELVCWNVLAEDGRSLKKHE
jgi:hypothetical protein